MGKRKRIEGSRTPPPSSGGPVHSAGGNRSGALSSLLSNRLLLLGAGFAVLIAVILGYLLWGGGPRPFRGNTSAYNVLLLTLDTTRADHLGCYGYEEIRTPIIDGLADTGVLFESAYTPAVMTLPSHASILTGLLPPTHGIRNNNAYRLLPSTETLAEVLKASGYRTGAAIGAFVLDSMFGLDQGFESYDDYMPDSGSHDIFFAERSAGEVTDAALRYLAEAKAQRWLLWVHYFDPHSPHRPPSPYREQYANRRYDGEIAYMDAEIGRLLAGLSEIGAKERTIIIVVGDHGEGLRTHGEQSHGVFLYDETARAPLIVVVPGFVEGPKRVRSVVRTTDIMPTVLDLLRLPSRPSLTGTSLWPLISGQTEDLGLSAFTESTVPLLMLGWSPMASLREGNWKLIQAPRPELYDLAADPAEKKNLFSAQPQTAEAMKRRLAGIIREASEAGRGAESVSPTPEEQAQLRSLGYAGGTAKGPAGALASDPMILLDGGARGLFDPKDRVDFLDRINKVYLAYGAGDFPTAVALAQQILAEDPDNDSVRQYMADSYRSMRRFEEAMAEYRALLAKDPYNIDVMLNTGWVLMSMDQLDQAKAIFERALAVYPGHTYAMASMGNISFVRGDYASAVGWYTKVLKQRPSHRQSILAMAKIFERQGMAREAEVFYKRAVEIDPLDVEALLSLGWIQFNAKKYEDALKSLDAAASVDPNMPELDLYRGDIMVELGRLDEAEMLYRRGIAQAPQVPQGYHGLGLVAEGRGDLTGARRYFEQALKLDPSFAASRERLKRIGGALSGG